MIEKKLLCSVAPYFDTPVDDWKRHRHHTVKGKKKPESLHTTSDALNEYNRKMNPPS